MLVTALLLLTALAWAAWLFSSTFSSKQAKLSFAAVVLLVLLTAFGFYNKFGASEQLTRLAEQHQTLQEKDLKQLLDLVTAKKLTIEQLFSELRLRNELDSDNSESWLSFGGILLQSGQNDLADQAFNRGINLSGDDKNKKRLEVARNYLDLQQYKAAREKINLVLLDNPSHEGALIWSGFVANKEGDFEAAIEAWQLFLNHRGESSESTKMIEQQMAIAQQKLLNTQRNFIEIEIENFSNLPLQSFTKVFALVRPAQGGTPIAVRSVAISDLTSSIKITPDNLMLGDKTLWQVTDIYIEIRFSQSGFAKPEQGDLFGKTDVITSISPASQFKIIVDQTVK